MSDFRIENGILKKYIGHSQRVIIPEGVRKIAPDAFSDRGVTWVVIPEGVISIGKFAFARCGELVSVELPKSVTAIGERAFSGCSALTALTIPEGVTTIGDGAFSGCSALTAMVIPGGVTAIGQNAFWQCDALTSVELRQGVTIIGKNAFYNCTALTSVTIPKGVTTIGEDAFYQCTAMTSVELPEGLTTIDAWAFCNCTALTSVVIPAGVTTIGDWAFSNCTALTSAELPEGVTAIGTRAFYNCTKLTLPKLPASLKSVGRSAFSGCIFPPGQRELILGTVLLQISPAVRGRYAVPEGVTRIEDGVFRSHPEIRELFIPNSVEEIGGQYVDENHLTAIFNESSCPILSKIVAADGKGLERITDGYFPGENFAEGTPIHKGILAVSCLRHPAKYSDGEREQYLTYLRRQSGKILERLAGGQDVAAAVAVMQTGFIKPAGYQKAVGAARGNPEMAAAILEYQHANVDLAREAEREEQELLRALMRTDL